MSDLVVLWVEMLSDAGLWQQHFPDDPDRERVHRWCSERCALVLVERQESHDQSKSDNSRGAEHRRHLRDSAADELQEDTRTALDHEDDPLLLQLYRRFCGPLQRKGSPLAYAHLFLDEAQDLSPVEIDVMLHTVDKHQSVTLAGDVAQRLTLENGFRDWDTLMKDLGLKHVAIEPLRIGYRSTAEIIAFAHAVLGPLSTEASRSESLRHGDPVDVFHFAQQGEAIAFLAETLRDLRRREPQASIALIARHAEQAALYFEGLSNAEVPYLRLVDQENFSFKPGIDVTDVRQVKGLEFDYAVLLDVSAASYPDDVASRHLLHIAATRAAHMLWVTVIGEPSPLLPSDLHDDGL